MTRYHYIEITKDGYLYHVKYGMALEGEAKTDFHTNSLEYAVNEALRDTVNTEIIFVGFNIELGKAMK